VLGAIPLAAYGTALEGGALRAREIDLPPGAKIAAHAHDGRPALVHVLEGELVEHRNDSETPLIHRQGDTYFEGPRLVHSIENVSGNPVRVFAVDILPPQQE
jgi:quercetin dioxygenase-like cupin family protein